MGGEDLKGRRGPRAIAVATLLAAAGLGGCNGQTAPAPTATIVTSTTDAQVGGGSGTDSPETGEAVGTPPDDREAAIRERYLTAGERDMALDARRRAELIGSCMREQGFDWIDYVPVIPPLDNTATNPYGWDIDVGTAAERGYGLIVDLERTRRDETISQYVSNDPNLQIRAGLSPEERLEYDIAWIASPLPPSPEELGELPPGTELDEAGIPVDWAEDVVVDETGGCMGAANREVFGPELTLEEAEALQDIDDRVESDREIIDVEKAWASCMAAEGYSIGRIGDLTAEIDRLLGKALRFSTIEYEEIEVRGESVSVPIEHFEADALQRLAREEMLLAVGDSTCRSESGFTEVYERVRERVTEEALDDVFAGDG
jgi:hypothetical protein